MRLNAQVHIEHVLSHKLQTLILIFFTEERLGNFLVSVENALDPDDPSSFNTCARVSGHLGAGETQTIPCTIPMFGQYVVIQLESTDRSMLTLCEV